MRADTVGHHHAANVGDCPHIGYRELSLAVDRYLNRGRDIAQELGLSEEEVSRHLGLLRLSGPVRQMVLLGQIAERAAYELSKLDSHEEQESLAQRAGEGGLTVEEAIQAVQAVQRQSSKPARRRPSVPRGDESVATLALPGTSCQIRVSRGVLVTITAPWAPPLTLDERLSALTEALEQANLEKGMRRAA